MNNDLLKKLGSFLGSISTTAIVVSGLSQNFIDQPVNVLEQPNNPTSLSSDHGSHTSHSSHSSHSSSSW